MDKYIYDKRNGLWYELQGDYYIPCLELPAEKEERHIGVWGQRHRRYLKANRRALYTSLLTSGKLNSYLADIDRQAEEMFSRLVKQLSEKEGVTETLKAENQKFTDEDFAPLYDVIFQNCTLEVNAKNDWGYTPIELARKLQYRADLLKRMTE